MKIRQSLTALRSIFKAPWQTFLTVFAVIVCDLLTVVAHAATAGSLDTSFDPGAGIMPITDLPVRTIFPLADGSFLIGGFFTNYNGVPRAAIAKVQENGTVDEAFVPDPSFIAGVTEVWSISQQADGKFIVSGINGSPFHAMIVRLNGDGSVDPSFVFDPRYAAFGMGVLVRPDGRIAYLTDDNTGIGLLDSNGARLLSSTDGISPFGIFDPIKISADGDTFYGGNSGLLRFGSTFGLPDDVLFKWAGITVFDLAFQSDGRVVCGGQSTKSLVVRYFANGTLDSNFKASVAGIEVIALFCQPDDKVIAGGTFNTMSGIGRRNLGRLNADGTVDTNFVAGLGPNGEVVAIAPARDNKILIAGAFTSYNGVARTGLARVFLDPPAAPTIVAQPTGTNLLNEQTLRLSAAVSGTPPFRYQWKKDGAAIDGATNVVFLKRRIRPDAAGSYTLEVTSANGSTISSNAAVAVSMPRTGVGSVVPGFPAGVAGSGAIYNYLRLPDGGSFVAGRFFGFDEQYRRSLARLSPDGSLADTVDYGIASPLFGSALASLADGTVLAGLSVPLGGSSDPGLLQLDANGPLLGSYFPYTPDITSIIPLADGKILVGGSTAIGGFGRGVVRLNRDLSLDRSFDLSPLKLTDVRSMVMQPDGKLIIGDVRRLLRVTDSGSVEADIAFALGLWPYIRTVTLQPDGKILVGGNFVTAGGVARTNLARFNSDMTLDANFSPAVGARGVPQSSVQAIVVESNGNIIVGGTFSDLAGASCTNIGRLLDNGQWDSSFQPNVGFSLPSTRSAVNTMTMEEDGTLTIGGQFSEVDGIPRNSLARIVLSEPPIRVSAAPLVAEGRIAGVMFTFPADATSDFTLQFSEILPASWIDLVAVPNGASSISQPFAGGQRFYRLQRKLHTH